MTYAEHRRELREISMMAKLIRPPVFLKILPDGFVKECHIDPHGEEITYAVDFEGRVHGIYDARAGGWWMAAPLIRTYPADRSP